MIPDCFKKKRADERKEQFQKQQSWSFVETYHGFTSPNLIIDTAATKILIGEITLYSYLKLLGLPHPEKLTPSALTHRFGLHEAPENAKYSAYIRLPIAEKNMCVKADVFPGGHPFLIGLSAQQRTNASINLSEKRCESS